EASKARRRTGNPARGLTAPWAQLYLNGLGLRPGVQLRWYRRTCPDAVMNDPRLNSVHLEFPRRHEFRQAREALLEARALRTLLEGQYEPAESDAIAMVRNGPDDSFPDSDYWLMDRAGIYPL